jgi:hypothetical protein
MSEHSSEALQFCIIAGNSVEEAHVVLVTDDSADNTLGVELGRYLIPGARI